MNRNRVMPDRMPVRLLRRHDDKICAEARRLFKDFLIHAALTNNRGHASRR